MAMLYTDPMDRGSDAVSPYSLPRGPSYTFSGPQAPAVAATAFGSDPEFQKLLQDTLNRMKGLQNPWSADMASAPQISAALSGLVYNRKPLDMLEQSAMRPGQSPWAKQEIQALYAQEGAARDRAAAQSAAQAAAARDAIATHGGLTSGAAERAATNAARDTIAQQQDISRQGTQNRLQVGINDTQNKISQLGMLPGLESQALQPEIQKAGLISSAWSNDAARQLQGNEFLTEQQNALWEQYMQGLADQQIAKATANAGGPSLWLCSRAHRFSPLSFGEIRGLKKLTQFTREHFPAVAAFYDGFCHELTRRMEERKSGPDEVSFVREAARLASSDREAAALHKYVASTFELIKKYWPDCDHPLVARRLQNGGA